LGAITTVYLLSGLFSASESIFIPAGTPKAVVLTTLDPSLSESYKLAIKANRKHYAAKHG
jgi:mannan polymerase II complex MNN11 subunit